MSHVSFTERVRAAQDPRQAMLILAEGIDAVLAALGTTRSSDGWGAWGGESSGRVDPAPPSPDFYDVTPDPKDPRYGILHNSGMVEGEPDELEYDEATGTVELPPASPEKKPDRTNAKS